LAFQFIPNILVTVDGRKRLQLDDDDDDGDDGDNDNDVQN